MIMKRLLFLVFALMTTVVAFGQNDEVTDYEYKSAWGFRVDAGFNVVGQYYIDNASYIEGRFGPSMYAFVNKNLQEIGLTSINFITAEFTILYGRKIVIWDGPGGKTEWSFDLGMGSNAGGNSGIAYIGSTLLTKVGLRFKEVPIGISFDYTPSIGVVLLDLGDTRKTPFFNQYGLMNIGVSLTRYF